jgi:uncharacterized protein YbcC (UPF0753/DUF2309 family)
MKNQSAGFNEDEILHELRHYLPTQAPLKDFIHHNSLHAFQSSTFHDALRQASSIFGYKVYLRLDEYRAMYHSGSISREALDRVIIRKQGEKNIEPTREKMLGGEFITTVTPRIGQLRNQWNSLYKISMDKLIHPTLFRLVSNYLDQGISIHHFPVLHKGFLSSVREIVKNSYVNFFRTERAKNLLMNPECRMETLLKILVGDETLFRQYLFDQQFAHSGWSGIVSVIEEQKNALLDPRDISLHDFIILELIMEIDALDSKFGIAWESLGRMIRKNTVELFDPVPETGLSEVLALWQEAYEWAYYDEVLSGLTQNQPQEKTPGENSFEAMFCIDDRELSLKRYIESIDPKASTHSTPGFFNVEFYFQPEHGKFTTKVCPAPLSPKFLVKELETRNKRKTDAHFAKNSHSLLSGWIISQTLGFWSALKLFINIFKPTVSPATSYSFRHMDKHAKLTIENKDPEDKVDGLQVGFTVMEMADRVEGLLKSIGMPDVRTSLIYMVGHGASSVNNTHYAGYDCGACSGRPGSVNARVFSHMANHPEVRRILAGRGISFSANARFVGALHDTTRDEIEFYDEELLSQQHMEEHLRNREVFEKALHLNAKERSRRFILTETCKTPEKVHEKVKLRSVSLFEPRPELNHATNALCIIGRRSLTHGLFLDRRAFLNSFDYRVDPEGKYLLNILKAAAPVCGGINLEYYFSRVDNYKLGAGTKLPHNVMGLIGVANGADGDLRPGLPSQMIEVHDPVRLLMIVEHYPEVVLATIKKSPETYEWFDNYWVHLIAIHPETRELSRFENGIFSPYVPGDYRIETIEDLNPLIESREDNLPVYILQNS